VAVEQLFEDAGITPTRQERGALTLFTAPGIDIFVGDIFDLGPVDLGPVDACYDRAALVALSPQTRHRYAEHLTGLTGAAPQLLISFDYDQSAMDGPPFSVDETCIRRFYASAYDITLLADDPVIGGLKGRCPALETVWLLEREDR
jgi:thiopurine S-methyltransferase